MKRWFRHELACALCCGTLVAQTPMREAPTPDAAPVNQLVVAGNACGPAALLNSFRFGAPHWHRASDALSGDGDREKILTIIREIGMRPSKHLPGRPRWSRRGVGLSDLRDMAEEMTHGQRLPYLAEEIFILKPRETPGKLLRRVHHRLEKSLAAGFPPVLSLRRHALRAQPSGEPQWVVIDAHFVTLTALPRRLGKSDQSFPVRYIDPWGGRHCEGRIGIPELAVPGNAPVPLTSLEAFFADAAVGKRLLKPGDKSVLAASAAIGKW